MRAQVVRTCPRADTRVAIHVDRCTGYVHDFNPVVRQRQLMLLVMCCITKRHTKHTCIWDWYDWVENTIVADEMRNNHLDVYKQPYSPCHLGDWKARKCMKNWLSNSDPLTLCEKNWRRDLKTLFRISSATTVPEDRQLVNLIQTSHLIRDLAFGQWEHSQRGHTVECHLSDHFGTEPMLDNWICWITDTIFICRIITYSSMYLHSFTVLHVLCSG